MNQVLRYALGLGADVTDREITWNGFTLKTHETPLSRQVVRSTVICFGSLLASRGRLQAVIA